MVNLANAARTEASDPSMPPIGSDGGGHCISDVSTGTVSGVGSVSDTSTDEVVDDGSCDVGSEALTWVIEHEPNTREATSTELEANNTERDLNGPIILLGGSTPWV